MPIEGRIVLSASYMCCCGLDVLQYITLVSAQEKGCLQMSDDQGTSAGTGFLTSNLVIPLIDELRTPRKAAHYFPKTDLPLTASPNGTLDKLAQDQAPCHIGSTGLWKRSIVA